MYIYIYISYISYTYIYIERERERQRERETDTYIYIYIYKHVYIYVYIYAMADMSKTPVRSAASAFQRHINGVVSKNTKKIQFRLWRDKAALLIRPGLIRPGLYSPKELDYHNEAGNADEFAKKHAFLPFVSSPGWLPELKDIYVIYIYI